MTRVNNTFETDRKAMIARIKEEARFTSSYTGRKEPARRVIQAMNKIPRHEFVDRTQQRLAYIDSPLPIECGQTISQPFIVALMTDLLDLQENDVVLEIGTGSGYQSAVLSLLAQEVYSIETHEPLARSAQKKLHRLGFDNVHVYTGDGYFGLPEHAPYDAIMVTAVAEEIPHPLLDQLKPGGRMVIPVGPRSGQQNLMLITKTPGGEIKEKNILPVAFVPLTRYHKDKTMPVDLDEPTIDPDQDKEGEINEN